MAKILFRLRQVPDDEADEVRQLLDDHGIDFYETSAGKFQISFPAIWVREEADEPRARQLIDVYQRERREQIRLQRETGDVETFLQRVVSKPAAVIGTLLFIAFILYLSIKPFVTLINQ